MITTKDMFRKTSAQVIQFKTFSVILVKVFIDKSVIIKDLHIR